MWHVVEDLKTDYETMTTNFASEVEYAPVEYLYSVAVK